MRAVKKEISRCYRLIVRTLEIKTPTHSPLTYLLKISERAGISTKAQSLAKEIIKIARNMGVSAGKDPMGFAAAALYIACMEVGQKKTQKDIAKASGVTEVTVRNRYKNLRMHLASKPNIAQSRKLMNINEISYHKMGITSNIQND